MHIMPQNICHPTCNLVSMLTLGLNLRWLDMLWYYLIELVLRRRFCLLLAAGVLLIDAARRCVVGTQLAPIGKALPWLTVDGRSVRLQVLRRSKCLGLKVAASRLVVKERTRSLFVGCCCCLRHPSQANCNSWGTSSYIGPTPSHDPSSRIIIKSCTN